MYNGLLITLKEVKGLDLLRAEINDEERAMIRREQKIAASFKFGKMQKTNTFLPSLHERGFL